MAKDIISMEPWHDKCPQCGRLIMAHYQIAVYEDNDSTQFLGLKMPTKEELESIVTYYIGRGYLDKEDIEMLHKAEEELEKLAKGEVE